MLQSELQEACQEYRKETEGEMRRLLREAAAGWDFDVDRYCVLSQESLLLMILEASAKALGDTKSGPKVEARHADQA